MINNELELAFDFVQYTNRNLFLTGKAGTGKTTFLHNLRTRTFKRMVVVAPTGVAAINAGGVTIHSFFQMPFGPILCERVTGIRNTGDNAIKRRKLNRRKIDIIRSLDLLVIDEISMVRADLLDGIDEVLRQFRDRNKPFGGVQLLMIGDLQQLAPVIKNNEWSLLSSYYSTGFFFSSKAYTESDPLSIELKHIFRQDDPLFINILNEIRNNALSTEAREILKKRYKPDFDPVENSGYIHLTTHNEIARRINNERLNGINGREHKFKASVTGNYPEYNYPTEEELLIKKGAQVMFVKNDSSSGKRYFNGKIGIIKEIKEDFISVSCEGDESTIEVDKEKWDNISYSIDKKSKEITENIAGTFTQYPLRLAWAITIHKSQGLTFEKAIIDAKSAFTHGQTYVALSRCKSLEGLVLSSMISDSAIISDNRVTSFTADNSNHEPDKSVLNNSKKSYQLSLLNDLFNYKQIRYHCNKLKKILVANKSVVIGNISDNITEMAKGIDELINIGSTFEKHLLNMSSGSSNLEDSNSINERIIKGSSYFHAKSNTLKNILLKDGYSTDNSQVEKEIDNTIEKLTDLLNIKMYILKSCDHGFILNEFLKSRAHAVLQKEEPVRAKKKGKIDHSVSDNPDLLKILSEWRKVRAGEISKPLFFVASQKLLIGLSNELPVDGNQMLKVKGMGKKKLDMYGKELIEIIDNYRSENSFADAIIK